MIRSAVAFMSDVGSRQESRTIADTPCQISGEPVPGMPAPSDATEQIVGQRSGFRTAVLRSGGSGPDRRQSKGRPSTSSVTATNENAKAAVPLLPLRSPFRCVCELPNFLVRGVSRHELAMGLLFGCDSNRNRRHSAFPLDNSDNRPARSAKFIQVLR
jgi:hypothetical protein